MIVADTNLIAYSAIAGERTPAAENVFQSGPDWAAPVLWRSEFRNLLSLHIKLRKLSLGTAKAFSLKAENLVEGLELEVKHGPVLELAVSTGLSPYDCEFISLAQSLGVPLVTADQKILRTCPTVAVSPRDFSA